MNKIVSLKHVINVMNRIFKDEMHAKRKKSLAYAVFGAFCAGRLNSSSIGRAMALLRNKTAKHSIKQVDRLLGNKKFSFNKYITHLVLWLLGQREKLVLTIDWTEFCLTGHYLLSINMVTRHGRATPLIWKTIDDRKLRNKRNRYEKQLLKRLKSIVPDNVKATVLADRGFCNTDFFRFITEELGWDFVIRIKNNIYVECVEGVVAKASEWVPRNGRILELNDAVVTKSKNAQVNSVIFFKKRGMKDAWHLASSIKGKKEYVVSLYERRFTCEENFRDVKDDRFGVGLKEVGLTTTDRRDKLLMINAIATVLLTVLGAVGESLGYSRCLKANTVKKRTHSLLRQGREYFKGVTEQYLFSFRRLFMQYIDYIEHTSLTYEII